MRRRKSFQANGRNWRSFPRQTVDRTTRLRWTQITFLLTTNTAHRPVEPSPLRSSLARRNRRLLIWNLNSFPLVTEPERRGRGKKCPVACSSALLAVHSCTELFTRRQFVAFEQTQDKRPRSSFPARCFLPLSFFLFDSKRHCSGRSRDFLALENILRCF